VDPDIDMIDRASQRDHVAMGQRDWQACGQIEKALQVFKRVCVACGGNRFVSGLKAKRNLCTNGYNLDAGRFSPTRQVQQDFLATQLVN
jgi:hypothetical protein